MILGLTKKRFFLALATTCAGAGLAAAETDPLPEGAWTAVVIPDTQYYAGSDKDAPLFKELTEWMVANQAERNIQLVLHVGDIVNNNRKSEWIHAKNALQVLDGEIPYVLAVGNHDLGANAHNRRTMLNDYFKITDNPRNAEMLGGLYQEGELENAWYRFRHGNWDAIIFSLEFGPRQQVVDWANGVAARHKDKSMVLVTHDFIDQESSLFSDDGLPQRTTPATKNSPHAYPIAKQDGGVHCGEELWDEFVSNYPTFDLVINGHYKPFEKVGGVSSRRVKHVYDLTSVHRSDSLARGEVTHQMLFNAQWAPRGGNGWLRLLEFQPDGHTIKVRTYSPHLDRVAGDKSKAWRKAANFEFSLDLKGG